MKFSQVKAVKEFCESLFSTPDWREVISELVDGNTDFEVDNVRFISADTIDEVLAGELANDEYMLGCFNASFLASVTGWPVELIEACQKGEAYSDLGKALIKEGYCKAIAEASIAVDGYGHHFNSYDFNEEEITLNNVAFYVFDNH